MSNVSWVHRGGPLARFAEGYGGELARLGFTRHSVVTHVVLLGQLSKWMSVAGVDVGDLSEERLQGFFDARRAMGQNRVPTAKTLAPLFVYLRRLGAVPLPERRTLTRLEELLSRYRRHLMEDRGLAHSTVASYEAKARLFLSERVMAGSGVEALCVADVTEFLLGGVLRARARVSQKHGELPTVAAAVPSLRRHCGARPRLGRAACGRLAGHVAATETGGF